MNNKARHQQGVAEDNLKQKKQKITLCITRKRKLVNLYLKRLTRTADW